MEKQGCIYMGTIHGKSYIGFTIDFPARKAEHEKADGKSVLFHRAINKYGAENIEWVILHEYIPQSKLGQWETWWIAFKETQSPNGYNILPGGEGGFPPHTDESKRKISESLTGRKRPPMSDEQKQKLSIANSNPSDETLAKMSEARRKRKSTKQSREKNSATHRGMKRSEEARRNISRSLTGIPKSEEHRRKISEAQKKRHAKRKSQNA